MKHQIYYLTKVQNGYSKYVMICYCRRGATLIDCSPNAQPRDESVSALVYYLHYKETDNSDLYVRRFCFITAAVSVDYIFILHNFTLE